MWYIRIVLYASLSQVMQCMHAVLCAEYSQYSWPLLKIVVCAVYVSFYFEVKNAVYTNDHKFGGGFSITTCKAPTRLKNI